ncbi:MAG: hypothetical protein A3K11_01990 [Nitrospirae bacterium RIFCSPLOWO2_12_FULL_63_8]|nr:MAG: hypothetical protein A3K11_01990 [Nitrospirae bacterium RIFCSPLOWO2_12_FULL_63_8]
MVTLSQIRSHLARLLHLKESPHRTALAFAVGVFIAFSPTYGLHTLSVLFCAWAFRLNAVALLAGSLITNPWTLVPVLGATLWTGVQLTGLPEVPSADWKDVSMTVFYEQITPYAAPFFLGGFLLSAIGAAVSYPLAYLAITTHRRQRAQREAEQLPRESGLG